MAATAAVPGARATKRRRTRKARLRTNADSSSSSSSSSSSESDSDSDAHVEAKPLPAPSSSDSSSDSDSDSSSSSSSSSSSEDEAPAPALARRAPLPDQKSALADYMNQAPLPRPEREVRELPEFPSRKEEKRLERQKKLQEQEERRAQMKRFTPSPLPSDEDSEDEALDALSRSDEPQRTRAARLERARKRAERILGQTIPDPVWAATGGEAMAAALIPKNLGLPPLPTPAEEARTRAAAQRAQIEKRQAQSTSQATQKGTTSWDAVLGQSTLDVPPEQDDVADIWMRSVADQFGEELNAIRERDSTLASEPERLPLLIDSLRAGAEALVFTGTGNDALQTVLESHKQWELTRAAEAEAAAQAPAESEVPPMPDMDIDMGF